WLVGGQAYITAHYQVRFGNNYVQSLGQMLYWLTAGYGTGKGAGLVGPPYFALVVYSQGDAWPVSAFLALLIACGLCLALLTCAGRALRDVRGLCRASSPLAPVPPGRLERVNLYVVLSIGLTLTPLLLKGTFGERYHVMFLVAALLASGLVFERW